MLLLSPKMEKITVEVIRIYLYLLKETSWEKIDSRIIHKQIFKI